MNSYALTYNSNLLTGQNYQDPIQEMQHVIALGAEYPDATSQRKLEILEEVAGIIQWMPQYLVVQILSIFGFASTQDLNNYISTLQSAIPNILSSGSQLFGLLKYAPYILAAAGILLAMYYISKYIK